jgi:DNA (cytosine-5)-methyltransferase 1
MMVAGAELVAPTKSVPKLGIIELFAGAAGLAQGFIRAGHYELIGLSDVDRNAKATFETNCSGIPYIAADIKDLEPKQLLDLADGRRICGVLGGPPCQGFSLNGLKNPDDERNKYVSRYVAFVRELDPDFLLMENVPQLLYHSLFRALMEELEARYMVAHTVLNAAQYGVPQTRHRAFLLAYHRRLGVVPSFPPPTHDLVGPSIFNYRQKRLQDPSSAGAREEILGADPVLRGVLRDNDRRPEGSTALRRIITAAEALDDLQPLESGERASGYAKPPFTLYQSELRRAGRCEVTEHAARVHTPEMLELIRLVPEGGDLEDVDKRYWPKSHYSQAYGRLHRCGLARTVTTFFCNPGSGRFIHYRDARALTVREAARLQGFPDDFVLAGTVTQKMALIGNAVPVPLARVLAEWIYSEIARGVGVTSFWDRLQYHG